MANFNRFIGVGRLTREVETKVIGNSKVAKIGLAFNNNKKNKQTGEWENDPVFIDGEAWNRGDKFKLADTIAQYCYKGCLLMVEGKLIQQSWDDKNDGKRRTKILLSIETIQLLEKKQDGGGGGSSRSAPAGQSPDEPPSDYDGGPTDDRSFEEIPF